MIRILSKGKNMILDRPTGLNSKLVVFAISSRGPYVPKIIKICHGTRLDISSAVLEIITGTRMGARRG
jgi:hypothetical protein